jgi:hypothetical protein
MKQTSYSRPYAVNLRPYVARPNCACNPAHERLISVHDPKNYSPTRIMLFNVAFLVLPRANLRDK